jgi:catechol 2,3-dioxygenase-like lactoylglutathione lyase family enzyme
MTHTLDEWLARYEAGFIDRRAFLAGAAALLAPAPAAAQRSASVAASGLHHVEIKSTDPARSAAFYGKLFGVKGEARDDRVLLRLGAGASRGYLMISRGPIPRVDHFSVKVPAMHPTNPAKTVAGLEAAGFTVRQAGHSVYVMDPDQFEVQVQAPNTQP